MGSSAFQTRYNMYNIQATELAVEDLLGDLRNFQLCCQTSELVVKIQFYIVMKYFVSKDFQYYLTYNFFCTERRKML